MLGSTDCVVELVDRSERPEADQAAAQILVVAGGEYAAAVLAEPHDRFGVCGGEPVSDVDGHQPELVVVQLVEAAQNGIVGPLRPAVARDHVVARGP